MYIDKQIYLSEHQEITTSAPSNVYDFGNHASVVPQLLDQSMQIILSLTGAFIGEGSGESLYLTLQTATDEDFLSPISLCHTNSVGIENLLAGTQFMIDYLPVGLKRFFRIYYNVTGTFLTGYVSSSLVIDKQNYQNTMGQLYHLILTTDDDIPILTDDGRYIYPF